MNKHSALVLGDAGDPGLSWAGACPIPRWVREGDEGGRSGHRSFLVCGRAVTAEIQETRRADAERGGCGEVSPVRGSDGG